MLVALDNPNQPTQMKKTLKEPTKRLHPVPIALPTQLLESVRAAADSMCSTQADTMRLALEIGLRMLRKANFDQAGAIIGATEPTRPELIQPIPTALRERRSK